MRALHVGRKHPEWTALAVGSAALLALRLFAATKVGFGDSEALYAAYALHPQPAYLDHPGLIGGIARAIGGGMAPAPERAHVVTSVLATCFPWVVALACRAAGAPWGRAVAAALVVALAPEVAVGLFALTPDLPLALAWTAALGLAADALTAPARSTRATVGFAAAGVCAGVAAASKVSGGLLMAALAGAYASRPARRHALTLAPWAGLAAGAVIIVPVVAWEATTGWPMIVHRLVDTQAAAGVSLRNVAAVAGGQLAYLSPVILGLAVLAARTAWRGRGDAVGCLLLWCFALPLAVLLALCLWSRVAEPHWLAPAWLALAPAVARQTRSRPGDDSQKGAEPAPSRRLVVAACLVGAAMVATAYAWVLVPLPARWLPDAYDPKLDLANELYGWPEALGAVREEIGEAAPLADLAPGSVAVLGPHWTVCAQLEAGLNGQVPVGCADPQRDDFDRWWPRDRWRKADVILWVTDRRFARDLESKDHVLLRKREVPVKRAGRTIRVFTIGVFVRRAVT